MSDFWRVATLLTHGKANQAIPLIQELLKTDPHDCQALCLFAWALTILGNNQQALEFCKRAAQSEPENEWPFRLQTIILLRLNRIDEAKVAGRQMIYLSPDDPICLQAYGTMLLRREEFDEALQIGHRLLEIAPDWHLSFSLMGNIALSQKNWSEAENYFTKVLSLNPESAEARNNLGIAKLRSGKLNESLIDFHEAAKMNPQLEIPKENLENLAGRFLPIGLILFGALFLGVGALVNPKILVDMSSYVVLITTALLFGLIAIFVADRRRRKLPESSKAYLLSVEKKAWKKEGELFLISSVVLFLVVCLVFLPSGWSLIAVVFVLMAGLVQFYRSQK